LAVENTFAATVELDLVAGLSYDETELELAQDYNATDGLFEYPTGGSDATNVQGAAYWRYAQGRELRGVISSRTRFPTIFERFSTRFGNAVPNPGLEPERAVNYELGWSGQLNDGLDLTAALFYADVEDMIQTVDVTQPGGPVLTQTQNVGDGEFYGVELGVTSRLTDSWSVSANYTHLEREISDPLQPGIEVVGAPDDETLSELYVQVSRFQIHPFVGWLSKKPKFVICENEVEKTISFPLKNMKDTFEEVELETILGTLKVPCFQFEGEIIWGATAMILSEFYDILDL
jgi:iron complex outermembrane receptor protein